MSDQHLESSPRTRLQGAILVLLFLGLAIALTGNIYQFVKSEHMSREMSTTQHSLQTQITRLSDATNGAFDVTQERFLEMKKLQDSTAAALADARSELKRNNTEIEARLEQKNQELAKTNRELAAQLAAFKQETASRLQRTGSGLQTTSAKLDTTSTRLDRVAAATDSNRADLKRVASDVAAMRTNLASNTKRAPVLRETSDPARTPFDLLTTKIPTRIGEIQVAIVSTDPKKNGYTMDLYTDDKVVRDHSYIVNEPVQFYASGHPQPYELVVTEVRKDEVVGYLSTPPKATNTKNQTSATTLRSSAGSTGRP